MTQRTVQCPLCGYETIVWDDETQWCPDCFGSREPALSEVTEIPAMAEGPVTMPVTYIAREFFDRLNSRGFDELQIYVGSPVLKEIEEEFDRASRVSSITNGGGRPHIDGVPVVMPDTTKFNELTVIDESVMTRNGSIRGYETVHLPKVMLNV